MTSKLNPSSYTECQCKVCVQSRKLTKICEKLNEEEVAVIADLRDENYSASEDLACITSGLDKRYLSREDLEKFLGITEEQFKKFYKLRDEEFSARSEMRHKKRRHEESKNKS